MFLRKGRFWHKLVVLLLALALAVLVLPGWVDDDGDAPVSPAPETSDIHPQTVEADPQLENLEPVRIGLLCDYTGQTAIGPVMNEAGKLVEDQVRQMGGILGGRPVKIETADGKGSVAGAIAGFTKLALEGVSVIVGGAGGAAGTAANVDTAEEYRMPYINFGKAPEDVTDYPYTVRAITVKNELMVKGATDFVLNDLGAQRVAILVDNTEMYQFSEDTQRVLKAAGVDVVVVEYISLGTMDFTPYLTKVKYKKADVIISASASPITYFAMFKQMMALGGWDGIKFLSVAPTSMLAVNAEGAEGTYHLLTWYNDMPVAGNQKFEQAFRAKFGRAPNVANFYGYVCIWDAVHAIILADSDDPEDIAKAMRSGLLTWESPVGTYTISRSGEHNMGVEVAEVRDGMLVPYKSAGNQ